MRYTKQYSKHLNYRTMPNVEQLTVIFLGPQGSGKGTQVDLLTNYLKQHDTRPVVLFSMGTALREFSGHRGYTQDIVSESLARGELQPLFLASALLAEYLVENVKNEEHLIVDGFPREENQIAVFDSAIHFYRRRMPVVFNVMVSDAVATERLTKRGRSDDEAESIKKRLAWSREHTQKVLEWFKHNPAYQYHDIAGERSVEDVHKEIMAALELPPL
jgi:adenylate kinase family enzyme